jgi:malonyl-CoA/methylmalonyl-CoA synthetase
VPADQWTPHLVPGRPFDPADLLTAGTLPALLAARWAAEPGRRALWSEGSGWWSAGRLDEATRLAAARLSAAGVSAGQRVVWSPGPSLDSAAACLGALRLGAVVVPVNPALTGRELAHVLADVRPAAAVADDPASAVGLAAAAGALGVLPATPPPGAPAGDPPPLDRAAPGDPALVVYTSGTTGAPKGAVLSHANLVAGTATLALAWRWEPEDRLVLALPLFHVHGLVAGLLGSLAAGGSAVVLERFSPEAVLDAGDRHRATLFFGVPTMYHRLVASARAAELGRLRLCVSGSAALSPDLWHRARRAGVAVLERYGMTETLLTVSNPYDGERRPGTVGFPLPGVSVRLDPEGDGEGPGSDGARALSVGGPTVFSGYWERPAATAESFCDGWFTTGDLVAVDQDGYLSVRGRRRDAVISGGFNVYPAEVEDVLCSHPSVAEAAVTGTPTEEWGEAVTAWVVPAAGPLDVEALLDYAAERLAPYKRPRLVRVVDALPRNAMGKVLRHELR